MSAEFWAERIVERMNSGHSLDAAVAEMGRHASAAALESARRLVEERLERVRQLRRPASISASARREWYGGPLASHPCWPPLERYLLETRKWPPSVVDSVDAASTKVVSRLDAPGEQSFNTRGLVLGHVQSGKTANFTASIAKAADAGYRLFIVLAGMHNGLRTQTQERLEAELVSLKPELWHTLTTAHQDFTPHGNAAAYLADRANHRVLCVIKKNSSRLRRLINWVRSASESVLARCPVLVIDDEADQASVDTSRTEDPSTINRLILELLSAFPKVGYVAYTATPFANILSDPSSRELLYPRDFIIDLPRPTDYYGAERLFGLGDENEDGLDVIRLVPDEECPSLSPGSVAERAVFEASVTGSLRRAAMWFWLASAVRRLRGDGGRHMSMLVHTSMLTDVHRQLRDVLDELREQVIDALDKGNEALVAEFQEIWDDEADVIRNEARPGTLHPEFGAMLDALPGVLHECRVIAENAASQERLHYPEDSGSCQIVVGGNTLSRGLTIEGLMVSFFVRRSRMYDTLLQMGRWFGYRHGYEDLPRIWMTAELQDAFQHLALVESEIREHIARYEREDCTPLHFAPHIQTHSTLAVTSPMKMQHAVEVRVSFDEGVKQTTYYESLDADWLERNIVAARELLKAADKLERAERVWEHNRLYRAVPVQQILAFLEAYQIHERHADMRPEMLRNYILEQNADDRLLNWNVGIVSRAPGSGVAAWDGLMPGGESISMINRARLKDFAPANVKAIMSRVDRALDFGFERPPRREPAGFDSYVQWTRARRSPEGFDGCDPATGRNTPLLLLYPIDPASKPQGSKVRVPLDAARPVVGLGLVFPRSQHLTPNSYLTANLARNLEVEEELDWVAEFGVSE